ncbi:CoA transferase [Arthrobacter sp. efr-133-TYG-118]|uniref:CaiB/BaiF CoA transferase family protein n=1 Tax=Arthrobacter sp. efr-133-TYG-118 TaxID=3040279 RepID=UPI00254EBE72|nr:CoA transferase [Arthrobacter sp. efr-133-TYG-118]
MVSADDSSAKWNSECRPFEGVRILDFTQLVAGPYATYQFALMGADVIKVERLEGEAMRSWDLSNTLLSGEWIERGLAPSWQAINAGKRSLALDLQRPQAVEIAKRLASTADVVVENFRPGVMDKLGLGYAALSELNPLLIYCALSAFGQTGPERLGAGYDGKIQAMSGIMAMSGHQSTGPTRTGFSLCDIVAGATAALGISSALFQRTHTGRGQLVDVSMLEATLAFLSGPIAEHTIAEGQPSQLRGNKAAVPTPTADVFETGDGAILLSVVTDKQFEALMRSLGRADAAQDARFSTEPMRRENEAALRRVIETALTTKSAREWETVLNSAGAPCASIWKVEDVIDHQQIVARDAIHELDTSHGKLRLAGLGFQLAHGGGHLDRMAPTLSQHTDEVLAEAGYAPHEIAALRTAEVI